jgi:D-serine dehydratase
VSANGPTDNVAAHTLDLRELHSERIDWRFKAFSTQLEAPAIGDVVRRGWNALAGDLSFPVLVLRDSALQHNIDLMARFCRTHGVSIAPHTKTPLSPQIALRQMTAGAWALSVATIHQARVLRQMGARRILMANQLLEERALEWVTGELLTDPSFDFMCLVDSQRGAELMEGYLARHDRGGPVLKLRVLLELGVAGGRGGCRTIDEARDLAAKVAASQHLELAGVEAYENVFGLSDFAETVRTVDSMLATVRELVVRLDDDGRFAAVDEIVVSAGGSIFFDRVAERLTRWDLSTPVRTVLRCGSYFAQDTEFAALSPLGGRATSAERLEQALELWTMVLSRPEPGLAVLGFGKRDVAHDRGLPVPFAIRREGLGDAESAGTLRVLSLDDQHARCAIEPAQALHPGDLVGLHVLHACTTFDNWRLIPLVDDEYRVLEAVRSFL